MLRATGNGPHADPAIIEAAEAFVGLGPDVRREALHAATRRKFAADTVIFEQGAEAQTFYVLLAGRLKVTQLTPDGRQITIRYINPQESFGCVAVCGGMAYPATATAAEDSWALGWSREATQKLAERFPQIAMNTVRTMGGRSSELQARLREMSTERVERRIAHALVRLTAQAGRRSPEGVVLDFPLSRQDLAELSGSTLATVSRTLTAWQELGIVALGRQRVVIRSPHALVSIAEDLAEPGNAAE